MFNLSFMVVLFVTVFVVTRAGDRPFNVIIKSLLTNRVMDGSEYARNLVLLQPPNNSTAQIWTIREGICDAHYVQNNATGLVLDVEPHKGATKYSRIITSVINGARSQQWYFFEDGRIVSSKDLRLAIDVRERDEGDHIMLIPKNDDLSQQFYVHTLNRRPHY